MDLHKLTHGLALLKSGLDYLDGQCTQQAAQCMQLRQAVAQQQRQRKGLQQQADQVALEVQEKQETTDDLAAVLRCLQDQGTSAQNSKQQLQVRGGGLSFA